MRRNQSNRRRTQKIFNTIARNKGVLAVSAAAAAVCSSQYAQGGTTYYWYPGTFNGNNSGNFLPTPATPANNWIPSGPPALPDDSANFTIIDNYGVNSTITFDIPLVTLGSMVFGNTDATPSVNWLLNPGYRGNAAIVFATSSGPGAINVENTMGSGQVVMNVALLGTQGIEVNADGSTGTLTLNGNSPNLDLGGGGTGIIMNSGVLNINNASAIGADTFVIQGGTIQNSNGGVTLAANNNMVWAGGFTYNSTNANPLNLGTGNVTLLGTAAANVVNVSNGALTITGNIIGTGGLTKTGTGALILGGTNTFSGGINIGVGDGSNPGELEINSAPALGVGQVTLGKSGNGYNNIAFDNTSGGAVALTNSVLNLEESVTFLGSNPLTFGTGAATNIDPDGDGTAALTVTVNNNSTLTLPGPVLDNASRLGLVKAGNGTLALTDTSNTSTIRAITVSGGTLSFANDGDLGIGGGTEHLVLSPGTTLAWNGVTSADPTSAVAFTLSGANTLNIGANSVAFAKPLDAHDTDTASLTITGGGTLTMSGLSNYVGGTTVAQGELVFTTGSGPTLGLSNSVVTLNSTAATALGFNSNGTGQTAWTVAGLAGSGALLLDGLNNPVSVTPMTLTLGGNGTTGGQPITSQVYTGSISGVGTIIKNGTYTQTLSGSSSSSGGIILNQGTLALGVNTFGSGPLTINGGTLNTATGNNEVVTTANTQYWNANIVYLGNASFQFGTGAAGVNGTINLGTAFANGSIGVDVVAGTQQFYDTITDNNNNVGINLTGNGRLYLLNANSFNGVTVNPGSYLGLGYTGANGTGALTMLGGTLSNPVAGTTVTSINPLNWSGDFVFDNVAPMVRSGSATLLNGTRAVNVVGANGTLTINGVINDGNNGYGITKNGAGTLILGGNNTYTGATTVNSGALVMTGINNYLGTTINGVNGNTNLQFSSIGSLGQVGLSNVVNISGGALTWAAGTTDDITQDATNFAPGNDYFNNLGNSIVISNALDTQGGTGQLVLEGTGTWTFAPGSSSPNFVGNFVDNGGTVNWANVGNFGPSGKSLMFNGANAVLQWAPGNNTDISTIDTLQTASGGIVLDTENNNVTFAGSILQSGAGSGPMTKLGNGTLTLNATQGYKGNTTINGGAIVLGTTNAIQPSPFININVPNGLQFAAGIGSFNTGVIAGSANETLLDATGGPVTLTMVASAPGTYSGVLSGAGQIIYDSTNIWDLNSPGSATNYTGTITIAANNALLGLGGSGALSGATLVINTTNAFLDNQSGNPVTIATSNNQIWDTGFTWVGGNALAFTAGSVLLGANNLTVTANVNTGNGLANPLILDIPITDGGSGYSFTKAGSGTLVLGGANTYGGPTSITNGTIFADSNTAFSTGSVTLSSGTTLDSDTGVTLNNNMSWSTSLTFGGTNNVTLGIPATVTAGPAGQAFVLTTGGTGTLTVAGQLKQAGAGETFHTAGSGNFTLAGTMNFSGTTTVNGGTFNLNAPNNIAQTQFNVNGGTVNLNGVPETINSLAGTGGNINLVGGGAVLNILATNTPGGATAAIAGAGSVVIGNFGGNGVVNLAGANTFTGGLYVDGATLALGATPNAWGAGLLEFNGGNIDEPLPNQNIAISGLTGQIWNASFAYLASATASSSIDMGNAPVTIVGGTKTVTVANYSLTEDGVISGSGGITKSGNGTLVLTGSNTFQGPITVNAGTLNLTNNNTNTGALTLNAGTLIIAGSDNTKGGTTMLSGLLEIGNNSSLGTGPITFSGGQLFATSGSSTLALSGNNVQTWNNPFSVAGNINLGTGAVTLNGDITITVGTGNGTGTVTVGGAVNDGGNQLQFTKAGAGTLLVAGNNSTIGTLIMGSGAMTLSGNNNNFYGSFENPAGVVVNGGVLTISGSGNSFGGGSHGVQINQTGELLIGNNTSLANVPLAVNGGELDASSAISLPGTIPQTWSANFSFGGSNPLTFGTSTITLTNAGHTVTVAGTSPVTINGPIVDGSAGYGITKAGSGTLVLAGNDTYSGPTAVTGGVLLLAGNNSNLGGVNVNSGGTLAFNALQAFGGAGTGTLNLNGGTLLWNTGTTDISSMPNLHVQSNTSLNTGTASSVTFGSALGQGDSGGITLIGTGTLSLNGAESAGHGYLGVTNVSFASFVTGTGTAAVTTSPLTNPVLVLGTAFAQSNGTKGNQIALNGPGANSLQFLNAAGPNFYIGGLGGTATESLTDTNGSNVNLIILPSASGGANYSGTLQGGGSLQLGTAVLQGGTQTLSGSNSFTGAVTLYSGLLNLPSSLALAGNNPIYIYGGTIDNANSAVALTLSSANAQYWNGNFTFADTTHSLWFTGGSATLGTNVTVTVNGTLGLDEIIPIGDNGSGFSITKSGPGSLTLGGNNTYTGATIDASGLLELTGTSTSNALTISGPGSTAWIAQAASVGVAGTPITFSNGGVLQWLNGSTADISVDQFVLNSAAILNLNGNSVTFNNPIVASGTGGITLAGNGTLALATGVSSNSVAGPLTIPGGTVLSFSALNNFGTGGLFLTGGTLQYASGNVADISTLGSGVTLTATSSIDTNGNNETLANGIGNGGSGGLTKLGIGTLTFSGSNTYLGATSITAGTIAIDNTNALTRSSLADNASGAVVFTPNTTGSVVLGGLSGTVSSATLVLADTNSNPVALTVGANNANTSFLGMLAGAGSLIKTGSGTLTLNAASNTYTGGTSINLGVLAINSIADVGAPGAATNVNINGGTLRYLAGNTDDISVDTLTFGPNGATIDTNGNNITFNNAVGNGGTSGFTKAGAGVLTIAANPNYSGPTTIRGGEINASSFSSNSLASFGSTNVINFAGGGIQWPAGSTYDLSTSGATVNLSANAVLDPNGNYVAFSAPFASGSSYGITVTGAGSLALASTSNTYTGATIIQNGGTLVLDNSQSALTPGSIINASSALQLTAGNLVVVGNSSASVTQGFSGTTLNAGPSTISIAPGSTNVMLNIGAIPIPAPGAVLSFNLASDNGTNSEILTPTGTANSYLGVTSQSAAQGVAWATVGLTDWAVKDPTNTFIEGGSQNTAFYTLAPTATSIGLTTGANYDITAGFRTNNGTTWIDTMRFNQNTAVAIQTGANASTNSEIGLEGLLVTPNVGANNVTFSTSATNGQVFTSSQSEIVFWQNNTQGLLIINGGISNNSAQTGPVIAGVGTVVMNNASTYTGNTYIDGGTLQIGTATALGTTGTTIALDGGILAVNSNLAINGGTAHPISVVGLGGGLQANSSNVTMTVDGAISGSGPLNFVGPGTVALSNANAAYSGNVTASNGVTVQLNNAGLSSGTSTFGSGTKLTGSGTISGGVVINASAHLDPGLDAINDGSGSITVGNLTLSYGSQTDFDLTNNGSSTGGDMVTVTHDLTISPSGINLWNDFSGGLSYFASSGTYDLFQVDGALIGSTDDLYVNNVPQGGAATYVFGTAAGPGGSTYVTLTVLSGGGNSAWNLPTGGTYSPAGNWLNNTVPNQAATLASFGTAITAPGTVTLDEAVTLGQVTFANTNSYTIVAGGGSLTMDTGNPNGNAVITDFTGSHFIDTSLTLRSNLLLTASQSGTTLTIGSGALGLVGPTKNVTVAGPGTVLFGGINNYRNTTVSAGATLAIGNGVTDSSIGTGSLAIAGGVIYNLVGPSEVIRNPISGTGTLTFNQPSGNTATLSASNTLSGMTTINGGTVALGSTASVFTTGVLNVAAGAVADLHGYNQTLPSALGLGAIDNVRAGSTSTLTFTGTGTFPGNIRNTGGVVNLAVTGGATTLSGSSTFTGSTTISGGEIIIGSSTALPSTTLINETVSPGVVLTPNVTLSAPMTVSNGGNNFFDFAPTAGATASLAGNVTVTGGQFREGTSNTNGTVYITGNQTSNVGFQILQGGNLVFLGNSVFTADQASGTNGIWFGRATTEVCNVTIEGNAVFNGAPAANITGGAPNDMGGNNTNSSNSEISVTLAQNGQLNLNSAVFDLDEDPTGTNSTNLNLNGGSMTVGGFSKTQTGANQLTTINFNGGTLTAGGSSANFLPALTGLTTNVGPGGFVANVQGNNITIGANLLSSSTADGGITLNGTSGTLTLTGLNTINGLGAVSGYPLTINGGTLAVTDASEVPSESTVLNNGGFVMGAPLVSLSSITAGAANIVAGFATVGSATVSPSDTLAVNNLTQVLLTNNGTTNILNNANLTNLANGNVVNIYNTANINGTVSLGGTTNVLPGGYLTVNNFGQGNLNVATGASATITTATSVGTISLSPGANVAVSGSFAHTNLNLGNSSTATVGGIAAVSSTLGIGNGAVATLNGTGGTNTIGYLSAASGTLVLGASVKAQLSQSVGGPPSVTHSVGTLTLGSGSSLDITNNTLLLNETNNSLSQVTTWVQNAATPGATAITSSLVYGPNSQASRTLGYGDSNADPLTVPAGYAEVKYTAVGDTNLDGVVDIVDLGRAINNLGQNAGYSGGDIANQGIVNIVDVADIINDLGGHLSPSTGLSASGVTGSGGSKAAVGFGGGGSAVSAAVLPSGGSRSSASPVVGTAAAKAVSHSGGSIGGSGAAAPDGTVTFVVSVNDDGFGDYTPNAFAIYAIDGTVSGTTVTHNSITANSGGIDGGISNVHVVLAGATPGSLRDDIYSGTTYTTHSGTGKGQLRSSSYYQLTDSATQSNGPSAVEAGFTYSSLHSDNSNTLVAAGQDTVGTPPSLNNVNGQNPSTLIIFGLGQSAGNMQTFANSTTGNNPGIPSGTQLSGSSPSTAPYAGPGTFTYGGNTYLSSLLVADGKYVTGTPPTINTATSTAGLLAAYDEAYSATAGGFVGAGSSTVVAVVTQTLSSSVPEPASLGLLTVGAMGLLARRRRRHAPAKES